MKLQSVYSGFTAPKLRLPSTRLLSPQTGFGNFGLRNHRFQLGLRNGSNAFSLPRLNRGTVVCCSKEGPSSGFNRVEPFHGKSGSVSFYGLTYQSVEEAKKVSAPSNAKKGSLLWILGPAAFILSLILPQFFVGNAVQAALKDDLLAVIVSWLSFEIIFYIGIATFLLVTDRIQRPYLQFSSKRWGLITGLSGFMTSMFLTMGFKVVAPLLLVYTTWSVVGTPVLIAVLPYLVGCIAQRVFEIYADKRGSSCWPLIPIVFEVYRLYQLTRAVHFIEKLMFSMRRLPESAQLLETNSMFVAMILTFQVLGVVCLWSLMTFLMRLFPSRPVADNY